jgi:hypothetical protein
MAKIIPAKKTEQDLQHWLFLVDQLIHQVEAWAKDRKWAIQRDQKQVHESGLGTYTVPVLSILAPAGQIHLDPVAHRIVNGDGRVDLIAWPSLTRMLLIREGNKWVIKTDSGVEWPAGWNQRSFDRLVQQLNAAA